MQIPDPKLVKDQARILKRSVWSPFAKFSSVLWLEVTGLFFALFALVTGEQVWKWHAAVRLPPTASAAQRLYLYTFLFALFGYFTVSSFVRARRRQHK
jgi:polyferredoxin